MKHAYAEELRAELQAREARDRACAALEAEFGNIHTLKARIDGAEAELNALRTYANSAGFRLVNAIIVRLKGIPFVFALTRRVVRRIVRRRDASR